MNYFIEIFGYDSEGSIINKLNKKDLLTLGFMMFSIYFGAGNLIFPPALGQAAGEHTLLAMIGFMATGVGLPLHHGDRTDRRGIYAVAARKDMAALCDGAAHPALSHHRPALCDAAHGRSLV